MKKQWFIVLLASAVMAASSLACSAIGWQGIRGSGHVIEKIFEVDDFTGVELATFGNLYIEVGDEEELRIEAEDNLIRYFEFPVISGMLKIESRPGVPLRPTRPVNFYLTVKALDTIVLSGSGDIEAPDLEAERISVTISGSGDVEVGNLAADAIKAQISGSGDLDISRSKAEEQEISIYGSGDVEVGKLDADVIKVRITGSGNLDILGGQVEEQKVTLSGSGDYRAGHLASAEADVRIIGSGTTTIRVCERLEARISGSGDVRYAGSPTVEQSVIGSGDVSQIGDQG